MLTQLYRRNIPAPIRQKIYKLFLRIPLRILRKLPARTKALRICLLSPFYPKDEYYNAWRFLGRHGWTNYPFPSSLKYKNHKVTVLKDEAEDLPYVVHNGKSLYFSRHSSPEDIINCYRSLLIEQDSASAHCYLESIGELKGKTLLDIGAAEGIIALDVIEDVDFVFLFECDENWIEALRATFKPWMEKVRIINKYVGDRDEDNFLTLDSLFAAGELPPDNLYLKMDIEGAEMQALRGAEKLLTQGKKISLAVCTYHQAQDVSEIPAFLESAGYECTLTEGFLFFGDDMRRAVCRAKKREDETMPEKPVRVFSEGK